MALVKPAQVPEFEPGLTLGAVRFDLFHRDSNGLTSSGAVIQRGRRILIDLDLYLQWLRARSGSSLATTVSKGVVRG